MEVHSNIISSITNGGSDVLLEVVEVELDDWLVEDELEDWLVEDELDIETE